MKKEYRCIVSFRAKDADGKTRVKRIVSLCTTSKQWADRELKLARKDPMMIGAFVEEVIT